MREAILENQDCGLESLIAEGAALVKEMNLLGRRTTGLSRENPQAKIPGFLSRLVQVVSHDDESGGFGKITELVHELTSIKRKSDERLIIYVMGAIREMEHPKILGALSGQVLSLENVVVRRPAFMELAPDRIKRLLAARMSN